jgi:predicted Rossmann-fold nucleotide-binding protein
MKIFVGGSLAEIEKNEEVCNQFVEKLGELIMERGHILLNGCRGSLDKKIAESAAAWLEKNGKDPHNQIHSYILEGEEHKQIHQCGSIFISDLKDWGLSHESLEVPEQIKLADATIFIGGTEGTLYAANWARIARKPILGIGMFGGSGYKINKQEKKGFEHKYAHLLDDSLSYGDLNQFTKDVDRLSNIVVSFCEDLMRSNTVFSIMSFKKEYNDVFDVFSSICAQHDFKAIRTDHDPNLNPITNRILDGIRQSDFVIADVSEMSPNVFYEIGYAQGINRPVIITAKVGTDLPFDIKDLPVIFYDRLNLKEDLEPKLEKYIQNQKIEMED